VDHTKVDPRLGTWADVARLARSHDVTADLIVNHISDESPEFLDFLAKGDASPHAAMFLERDDVFFGEPTSEELAAIYRPRPTDPFTTVEIANGERRTMWTTFTPHQIDLDVRNPRARRYLGDVLDRFADTGVQQVRLDAVGYAVKTRGTSSFMTPDTYAFIEDLGTEVSGRGMKSLLEIHSHYSDQISMAERTDRVYDFALPPLILHALHTGSATHLARWLEISPHNAITVLDTHDGIGVVDVGPTADRMGLLAAEEIDRLVNSIHSATEGESRMATGAAASNLDLYQVNSTYYSALGCDDDRYLLARLIQFFSPGIPQVYYAGLLAARNDMALLERTSVGRDINRPYFDEQQVLAELERPVVRHLIDLARFRNTHPAFGGVFHMELTGEATLRLGWRTDCASVEAWVDLATGSFSVHVTCDGFERVVSGWGEFSAVM
jgi:sucrose phosphorylase